MDRRKGCVRRREAERGVFGTDSEAYGLRELEAFFGEVTRPEIQVMAEMSLPVRLGGGGGVDQGHSSEIGLVARLQLRGRSGRTPLSARSHRQSRDKKSCA